MSGMEFSLECDVAVNIAVADCRRIFVSLLDVFKKLFLMIVAKKRKKRI
jgi:hypothetical protein